MLKGKLDSAGDFFGNLFKAKAPPLIGVDISSSSVKMVELADGGKGRIRLERYAIEPLAKDAVVDGNIMNLEAVGDSVRRGWKRMGTRIKSLAMALPSAQVITKKITVPAGLREDELAIQVETEANQYIPFALEEVNLDFQVLGAAPNNVEDVEVMIAASRKEKVEDRVAVAEFGGLKAVVMDIDSFAAQTAFELMETGLPEGGRDQVIALVDVGASMMNINVLRNNQSVYMREQPFGGNQLTQEGRGAHAVHGHARARGDARAPVLLHVHAVQPGELHLPLGRLCNHSRPRPGGGAAHRGHHHDRQPVRHHAGLAQDQAAPAHAGRARAGGGHRTRHAEVRRMIPINLLPHREERRKAQQRQFAVMALSTLAIGAGVVILVHGFFAQRIENQNERNRYLDNQIVELDKQIDEIRKLKEQTQAMLERKKVVESLQSNRTEAVRLMDQLVRQLPDGLYLKSVKQSGDLVNVIGYATSNARVSTLMRNFEASPWLESPQLLEIKASKVGNTNVSEFSLNIRVTRPKDETPDAGKRPAGPVPGQPAKQG